MSQLVDEHYVEMSRVGAWALDFCRAVNERHTILKRLFRLIIGKYAMREFYGMWQALEKAGYYPEFNYELEDCDYNKEKVPENWWERGEA